MSEHGGVCVKLSPGTFLICSPLIMKNGVKLIGSEKTILKKCDSCTLKLIRDGDIGERELLVDGLSNSELNLGMGLKIYDDIRFSNHHCNSICCWLFRKCNIFGYWIERWI